MIIKMSAFSTKHRSKSLIHFMYDYVIDYSIKQKITITKWKQTKKYNVTLLPSQLL